MHLRELEDMFMTDGKELFKKQQDFIMLKPAKMRDRYYISTIEKCKKEVAACHLEGINAIHSIYAIDEKR